MNLETGDKESLFLLRKPWILLIIIAGIILKLTIIILGMITTVIYLSI